MTDLDRINRARWSRDQQSAAREQFASSLPSSDDSRATKLAELRRFADALEALPHMATTLVSVRAQIAILAKTNI